jgi:hypothetical protein
MNKVVLGSDLSSKNNPMTPSPKEKAKELVFTYEQYKWVNHDLAKKFALIAVNEIIASIPTKPSKTETERLDAIMYWLEVKQELEKL